MVVIDLDQAVPVVRGQRTYFDDHFINNLHLTQSLKYPFLLISLSVFHARGNIFSALHRLTRARTFIRINLSSHIGGQRES